MLQSLPLPRFDVLRAGRALSALLKNPDDLPQVFTLIDAMSGTAPIRFIWSFRHSASGRRLLEGKPDIVTLLSDREGLRRLPPGSLGRAYLDFVESEGISAAGIVDASKTHSDFVSPDMEWIHGRMRDTHDLWHPVAGYKGDVLGELALLAFSLGQHWNSAIGLIIVGAVFKGMARSDLAVIWEGYLRGRKAEWLPAAEWEEMLALPLEEVRERMKVGPPPAYVPVRSDELRAQGVIGAA